jgi:hypothetical protein
VVWRVECGGDADLVRDFIAGSGGGFGRGTGNFGLEFERVGVRFFGGWLLLGETVSDVGSGAEG